VSLGVYNQMNALVPAGTNHAKGWRSSRITGKASVLAAILSGESVFYGLSQGECSVAEIVHVTGTVAQLAVESKHGKIAVKTVAKWAARAAAGTAIAAAGPAIAVLAAVAFVGWTIFDGYVLADAYSQVTTGQGLGSHLQRGVDWFFESEWLNLMTPNPHGPNYNTGSYGK
jgi:hypothetical protein